MVAAAGKIDGVMGYFGLKESNRLSLFRRINNFLLHSGVSRFEIRV